MTWSSFLRHSILVVDDNDSLRRTICDILENEGYAVFEAENGKTAENCCETNLINLIITDIFMPVQDGLETIAKLRAKMPCLKIIAMSGEGPCFSDTYLKTAVQLGALRSLPKPFKANDLLFLIDEMLTCH